MPIKIQGDLPVKEILERENIFVMDEGRAVHQDIRPLQILILDLMMLFLHHIPDIQRFQSKISVHVKISRFLQNLRRRGFFLQWRRGDVRFLSWDIRNMTV